MSSCIISFSRISTRYKSCLKTVLQTNLRSDNWCNTLATHIKERTPHVVSRTSFIHVPPQRRNLIISNILGHHMFIQISEIATFVPRLSLWNFLSYAREFASALPYTINLWTETDIIGEQQFIYIAVFVYSGNMFIICSCQLSADAFILTNDTTLQLDWKMTQARLKSNVGAHALQAMH